MHKHRIQYVYSWCHTIINKQEYNRSIILHAEADIEDYSVGWDPPLVGKHVDYIGNQ